MIHPLIQKIIDSTNSWGGWSHQNSHLELASLVLEARVAGLDITPLKALYDLQISTTRTKPGHFLRSPDSTMATSHDELIGLVAASYLFDGGAVAREILDNTVFGIWNTGKNEHGNWFDFEWFILWRPEYQALAKLAAGRKLNIIQKIALNLSLIYSKAFNVKRVKLLFLYAANETCSNFGKIEAELGNHYKGQRQFDDPIYKALWETNEGRYTLDF